MELWGCYEGSANLHIMGVKNSDAWFCVAVWATSGEKNSEIFLPFTPFFATINVVPFRTSLAGLITNQRVVLPLTNPIIRFTQCRTGQYVVDSTKGRCRKNPADSGLFGRRRQCSTEKQKNSF